MVELWSRERKFDPSTLDKSLQQYLEFNQSLLESRKHYSLIKILEFMRQDLAVNSIDDLLKMDTKTLIMSLQKWINKRAQETSIKTIKFEVYLARSFFSFHDIELPPRKVKLPRKAYKSRIDRIPSLAEIQKLVMGVRSPRMRLAIMMMALTGMRLSECLSVRREHVDFDRGVIVIPAENTKMGRYREVPIPSELRQELQRYFSEYFKYEKGYLFSVEGNPEKRIIITRFYEDYVRILRRLGLDQRTPDGSAYLLHPHVFRKWYRTMLESAGVNKLMIDLWLGHNSNSVERLYYLPTPEMIRQEFQKADKVLRIFGQAESTEVKRLEDRLRQLESFINRIERWYAVWHPEDVMVPTPYGDMNYEEAIKRYLKGEIDLAGPIFPKTPREAKEILDMIRREKLKNKRRH